MMSTTDTANPWRCKLLRVTAVSTGTSGRIAITVASRGMRGADFQGKLGGMACRRSVRRGQQFTDALELLAAAAGRHLQRFQAVVLLAHLGDVAGVAPRFERQRALFLFSDAVSGVPTVAGDAHLLPSVATAWASGRGRGHGQFGSVRLTLLRVAVDMKIEQDRGPASVVGSYILLCRVPVRAVARQWMRLSGSPVSYGRTPAIRVGSSYRRWVKRMSPMGRRDEIS